tara:strand:- start:1887 stop:2108 length:222 start_codon:yes stop_codon:yes gene_type:complete
MKSIKLKESTLRRIVERVVLENKLDAKRTELQGEFEKLAKDPNCEECLTNIARLSKELGLPVTNTGKEKINKT